MSDGNSGPNALGTCEPPPTTHAENVPHTERGDCENWTFYTPPPSDHVLTIEFDGEYEHVNIRCRLKGAERPCAVIDCPVDHEDVTRDCIEAHGAVAKDECWAEEWIYAGGRECLNADSLDPIEVPVSVHFDDGVAVENA